MLKNELEFEVANGPEKSINQEKEKVINDIRNDVSSEGLQVVNLKKTYRKFP